MSRKPSPSSAKSRTDARRANARRRRAGGGLLGRWKGMGRLGDVKMALAALVGSALFLTVVWSAALGGPSWMPKSLQDIRTATLGATGDAGFRVEEVLVAGRDQTDRDRILSALGVARGDPILGFDPHQAHKRVMDLPWIRSASVERRLPGTILVRIEERVPMALWQNERRHSLIDREGNILANHDLQNFTHLPMVVGSDAHRKARVFLDVLSQYPNVADLVDAAIRVGERRWDLRLTNGVEVRLPETGLTAALDELSRMTGEIDLFERDVVAIDLRLEDRLVVQTSPLANENRRSPEENT